MAAEARGLAGGTGGRREATKFLYTIHHVKLLYNRHNKYLRHTEQGCRAQHSTAEQNSIPATMLQFSMCTLEGESCDISWYQY